MDKSLILNKIKKHFNFKSNKDFAEFLGIKPTTLAMWYNRNVYVIELLFNKCEGIDANWLLTGSGSMFRNENVVEEPAPSYGLDNEERFKEAKYTIELQKEYIANLKFQINELKNLGIKRTAG